MNAPLSGREKVDRAIVDAIIGGHNTFRAILEFVCFRRRPENPTSVYQLYYRVVDGRLQALRKRGVIRFNRETRRWEKA